MAIPRTTHAFRGLECMSNVGNVEWRDAGAEAFTGKMPVPRAQALECGSGAAAFVNSRAGLALPHSKAIAGAIALQEPQASTLTRGVLTFRGLECMRQFSKRAGFTPFMLVGGRPNLLSAYMPKRGTDAEPAWHGRLAREFRNTHGQDAHATSARLKPAVTEDPSPGRDARPGRK